jgi:hypothetical protein
MISAAFSKFSDIIRIICLRLAGEGEGSKIILAQLLSMTLAHFRDSFITTEPSAPQHQYAAQLLTIKRSIIKPRPSLLQVAHLFVTLHHAVKLQIFKPPCHRISLSLNL